MTKNSLYCIGTIRGTRPYEFFVKAKSVDKLKEKVCKQIDDICEEQNKTKAGSFIPTIFE